ncbi:hypothetical protein FHS43_003460 [Streptosporangium becharense]|uniref:Uncharacterized protein n=1 Tax=Streptosporangium becharense TaxID=1816182 RepID=A0A7W9MF70_9ACTN|nr:hypothetical protein [Streptosporangium becharense]MBB5818727.1 hypothetical protein [Streptosporangium becharense]
MPSGFRTGLTGAVPGSVWVRRLHPGMVPSRASSPAHKAVMR